MDLTLLHFWFHLLSLYYINILFQIFYISNVGFGPFSVVCARSRSHRRRNTSAERMLPQSSFETSICNISLNISDVSIFIKMFYILKWEMLVTVWASEEMSTEMSWALKETFYLVKNKSNKLFQGNFWAVFLHTQYIHNIAAM